MYMLILIFVPYIINGIDVIGEASYFFVIYCKERFMCYFDLLIKSRRKYVDSVTSSSYREKISSSYNLSLSLSLSFTRIIIIVDPSL